MSFGCDDQGEFAMVKPFYSIENIRYKYVVPMPHDCLPVREHVEENTIYRDPDVHVPETVVWKSLSKQISRNSAISWSFSVLDAEPNRMKLDPSIAAEYDQLMMSPIVLEKRAYNETIDALRSEWLWEDYVRQNHSEVRVHPREHRRYNTAYGRSGLSQSASDRTDDDRHNGLF